LENIQRNLIKLFEGNLKEISQFFEGNFGQNKEKKMIFWFFKVEALQLLLVEKQKVFDLDFSFDLVDHGVLVAD
jgi:hypothetical protein